MDNGRLYTKRRLPLPPRCWCWSPVGPTPRGDRNDRAAETTAAATPPRRRRRRRPPPPPRRDDRGLPRPPTYANWDEVLAAADGTTVNWFMWGGDDTINSNVDSDIGGAVLEQFGVTLNRVPLTDTADAVNQVLNESSAGVTHRGQHRSDLDQRRELQDDEGCRIFSTVHGPKTCPTPSTSLGMILQLPTTLAPRWKDSNRRGATPSSSSSTTPSWCPRLP